MDFNEPCAIRVKAILVELDYFHYLHPVRIPLNIYLPLSVKQQLKLVYLFLLVYEFQINHSHAE